MPLLNLKESSRLRRFASFSAALSDSRHIAWNGRFVGASRFAVLRD